MTARRENPAKSRAGAKATNGGTGLHRFKPYPAYKASGVEWLREVPSHWKISRLANVTALVNGYPFDSEFFVRGEGAPLVRIRDLNAIETEIKYIGPVVGNAWIDQGEIIIGMDGDFNVARWRGQRALLNQRLCCLRPRPGTGSEFIAYLLPVPLGVVNDLAYSTTVKHLSSGEVRQIRLALPEAKEQHAIAAFLDRETQRIDALVEKKELLLDLLLEQRAAMITRAVTSGLAPNAPKKASGVGWLGQIPAHWSVRRLWHLTSPGRRIMYGIVLPGPNVEIGVPIVKGGDVSADRLRLDQLNRTTFEIESGYVRSRLREDDLVIAIRGSIGEVAVVPCELDGANLTQDAARVSYTRATHGRWLLYALKSSAVFAQLDAGAVGATIRGINIRDLKRASIPVPPLEEQEEIAKYLDKETAKIDALVSKVREAIDRLKELRTALISAAVTGKIDIREETA